MKVQINKQTSLCGPRKLIEKKQMIPNRTQISRTEKWRKAEKISIVAVAKRSSVRSSETIKKKGNELKTFFLSLIGPISREPHTSQRCSFHQNEVIDSLKLYLGHWDDPVTKFSAKFDNVSFSGLSKPKIHY